MPGALRSSARLTLAGTLRGKRWRRQEVRAFRERKRNQQQMAIPWALDSCPPLAPSACVQPGQQRPSVLGVLALPHAHSNLLDGDPVQPNPSPRPRLLSSSPPLSSLPPRLSVLSSPAALGASLCSQAQGPHQHSVLKLLGLRLQLHTMLLEHSPLAQAPPDAVCRWTGACSELPLPWPPTSSGLSRGRVRWEEREKERQRRTGTHSFPSWVTFLFLLEREGVWRKRWFPMFLNQGTAAE